MIQIKKIKKYLFYSPIICLAIFLLPLICFASWKDTVDLTLGWIASAIVGVLGGISMMIVGSIISIANYNDFINQNEIVTAWKIIRDFSNMWFILILLVIAFATILRIETYNMKKWLPKLLIMAVLINFSRTICGVMIDFSQVIMLTFVNTFTNTGGEFIGTLQMQTYVNQIYDANSAASGSTGTATGLTAGEAAKGYILACIFMIIAVFVLSAILIVFLMRMIMLWILIALSPLAFMLSTFPQGAPYASKYWGEFTKYLINGPVLAFFLWLSLSVAGNMDPNSIASSNAVKSLSSGAVGIMSIGNFISFILSIGFLSGGLMLSSQIGGIGAAWGYNTARNLGNKGMNITRRGVTAPFRAGGAVAKFGGSWALDKLSLKAGVDLNVPRVVDRYKAQMQKQKRERADDIYEGAIKTADSKETGRFRSTLALASTGDLAWRNISNWNDAKKMGTRLMRGNKWYNKDEDIAKLKTEKASLLQGVVDKKSELAAHRGERPYIALTRKQKELKDLEKQAKVLGPGEVAAQLEFNKRINAKRNEIKSIEDNRPRLDKEHQEKEDKLIAEIKQMESNSPERIKEIDNEIGIYGDRMTKYKFEGLPEAEGAAADRGESEARKVIGSIDNTDKLLNMMEEAIQKGNQPLIRAIAKKVTKNGDLNDLMKKYNLGTTLKDFHRFASMQLQKKAGFSQQSALGLLAELGGIAKNINQFYAYGTVKMDHDRWVEASQDEKDEAWASEMMNVQPQKGARDMGRLAYIEYTNGDHTQYQISRPGIMYIKENAETFGENMEKTGNQKAAVYLADKAQQLRDNHVEDGVIDSINKRRATSAGTNYGESIKNIKLPS